MERFIIGHNADPSNWRQRLERLAPRCLEIFVPPSYSEGEGLAKLHKSFEEMASHPIARSLEFASCHFPWGESANGHSRYNLADYQYFYPFAEIARAFHGFCGAVGLLPERCALNFHNLYELPRPMLERLKEVGRLAELRRALLEHARVQTATARRILDILGLPLTLVNENNPPIGDGDRMSVMDVFSEDLSARASALGTRTCLDLSHFFMTKFYYEAQPHERPSFPYLELETMDAGHCTRRMDFQSYLHELRPLHFHISDTKRPGATRDVEGLSIGSGDTPWTEVVAGLGQYAASRQCKLFLIIEIKGGHTAEGTELCASSEEELRGIIEDCFASGFLEAIQHEESS